MMACPLVHRHSKSQQIASGIEFRFEFSALCELLKTNLSSNKFSNNLCLFKTVHFTWIYVLLERKTRCNVFFQEAHRSM